MKKNSFVEGTIVAYLSILITKIIGAIYVIPFYNIIGENGGVLYSYAYNIYNLFLNISTSGIPTAVAIIISEYNALKMFNEREFTYKIANKAISIISFLAFIVMFVFAKYLALFFIGDMDGANSLNSVVLVIRVISLCLLVVPFLSVTRGYLQGNKYVAPSSFSQLLEQIARIFIVLLGSYITINVLHYSVSVGVAVALFGTVFGAGAALIFLKLKIIKNKNNFLAGVDKNKKLSVTKKDIIKKIIKHAIPVIIIAITQNLYEIVDLKFIIRGLYGVGFSASDSEVLGSIVVTWTPKICMLINALAIGLSASIIPFIVEGYTKKNIKLVNNRFNQAINTILFVGIPLAIFIIAFSKPLYYIFYGESLYGGIILKLMAFVSIFFSIHMVVNMMLQGMKKYKIVYLNTFIGLFVNALMDIPMILLLNKIGFHPYLGTLIATLIGQIVSLSIVFVSLKKEHKFEYKPILKNISRTILPILSMIIIVFGLSLIINFNGGYLVKIIKLGICGIISVGIYVLITYKTKSLQDILGEEIINKILNKLHIKKKGINMNGTYVEINLDNIENNVKSIIKRYKYYDYYIGVLKGDAYGHGEYIVNTLIENGINYIAVSTIEEGLNVRKFNKNIPILLLEPILYDEMDVAINNNFTLTIHELDYVLYIDKIIKKKIKCHIKIDSGMGRLGFTNKEELKRAYDILEKNKYIEIEGIYSHFATIGLFDKKWDNQLDNFKEIISLINLEDIPIRHMGSSIVMLAHPKIEFCNAIRMGTLLYGYNISPTENSSGIKNKLRILRNRYYQKKYNISKTITNVKIDLKPCMSFYTNILQIKKISAGESIGYGGKVIIVEDTLIAIIPIGYNNGIGTENINRYVYINNQQYQVLSVGMNMSFVKVDENVKVSDKVVILDNKNITIGAVARFTNRTFHEMLLSLGKNNKRVYVKNKNIEYIEE